MKSLLYPLLRALRDASAASSGNVGRRVKNRAVGRALGRSGFWRNLWR